MITGSSDYRKHSWAVVFTQKAILRKPCLKALRELACPFSATVYGLGCCTRLLGTLLAVSSFVDRDPIGLSIVELEAPHLRSVVLCSVSNIRRSMSTCV